MPIVKLTVSKDTSAAIKKDIALHIEIASANFGIETALIKAIIKTESDFIIQALRYEPHLKRSKWYNKTLSPDERMSMYCYSSLGLMQTLYGIAKDIGFKGTPFDLIEPTNSIHYGTKHLYRISKSTRNKTIKDVISSYNQGRPKKKWVIFKSGKRVLRYCNQYYVNKVYREYKRLGGTN